MRVLSVWLPKWPIQRLVVQRPELRRQAIALTSRQPRRGLVVAVCSPAAWRDGVREGMPLAEAQTICSRLHVESQCQAIDQGKLVELAQWCQRFSPRVSVEDRWLEKGCSADSLSLDLTGMEKLYDSDDRLLEDVDASFAERGYLIRQGLAETLGGAWAVAHHASSIQRPAIAVATGCLPQTLSPLPVESLRLPSTVVFWLKRLGIQCVGQLVQLPRNSLAARFGKTVLDRIDQAHGRLQELVQTQQPQLLCRFEHLLEHPLKSLPAVQQIVQQLLHQLLDVLRPRRLGVLRLSGGWDNSQSAEYQSWEIGLYRATLAADHLWSLLRGQLERQSLRHPVEHVWLEAPATASLEDRQGQLFVTERAGAGHPGGNQLAQLLDRLSNRIGADQVLRPQLTADAQPERAFRYRALTNTSRSKRAARPSSVSVSAAQRPPQFYTPPLAIEILQPATAATTTTAAAAAATTTENQSAGVGPPQVFRVAGRCHQLAAFRGPERIETAWWRGPAVQRDYYQVETAEGTRFWLFQMRRGQRTEPLWFLHGCF